eukprot:2479501-Pleurochrysis_carterae.AAC.3
MLLVVHAGAAGLHNADWCDPVLHMLVPIIRLASQTYLLLRHSSRTTVVHCLAGVEHRASSNARVDLRALAARHRYRARLARCMSSCTRCGWAHPG